MSALPIHWSSTEQPMIASATTAVRLRCKAKHGAIPLSCDRPIFHEGAHMSLPVGWL